ncbi:MAG: MFS transporter [Coraliomargaritaceae bacterium]
MTDNPATSPDVDADNTRPEDVVPVGQKIAYSMGVVSDHYANVCLAWIFMTPFFVDFLGLGASVIGWALGAARLWDAVTDPLAGRLSDRCKSKYGRRKPFIFVGAILTGLMFPIIWMVPEAWSTTAITVYLFVALMIFYSTYSIFSVPYEALGAELTPDYRERSKIFVVRKYVQETFNLGIVWIFPLAAWVAKEFFEGDNIQGIRSVSWLIAAIIIIGGILPAIFNKERYKDIAVKEEEAGGGFLEAVKALTRNKPLLMVVGIIAIYLFSIMATANLSYFVNVYYIFEGDVLKGAALGGVDGTLRFFFALGAAWMISKMTDKVDKHKIMMGSVIILMIAFVGMYFTTIPGKPVLSLCMKPLVSIGECGFWVLILSMRADVCDWDEYNTGTRSEGMVAAITNWCNKIAMTVAIVASGYSLQYIVKFDSQLLAEETRTAIEVQAETGFADIQNNAAAATAFTTQLQAKKLEAASEEFAGDAESAYGELGVEPSETLEVYTQNYVATKLAEAKPELIAEAKADTEALTVSRYTSILEDWKEDEIMADVKARAAVEYASISDERKQGDKLADYDFPLSFFLNSLLNSFRDKPYTLDMHVDTLKRKVIMDQQSPGTMERLRFLYCIPQAVALLICLFLLRSYPLTRGKMKEIRAELERRRGKAIES